MRVAISGASGFVGRNLSKNLKEAGFSIVPIDRTSLKLSSEDLANYMEDVDIVINLAGSSIIKRWSESYKKELYSSRIETTKKIVDAIEKMEKKPKLLISTSAVGIYDNSKIHSEKDFKYSDNFLSKLCQDWEREAMRLNNSLRVVIFRFGIVLGKDGGALSQMLLPFKLGLGGVIKDGSQGFSFIHIYDLIEAFKFIIEREDLDGVFNLSAPEPTTNRGLTKALGKYLNRPTILPVPEFILKLIFGEGAKVLTDGEQMIPERLLESGFNFRYRDIYSSVENLVKD